MDPVPLTTKASTSGSTARAATQSGWTATTTPGNADWSRANAQARPGSSISPAKQPATLSTAGAPLSAAERLASRIDSGVESRLQGPPRPSKATDPAPSVTIARVDEPPASSPRNSGTPARYQHPVHSLAVKRYTGGGLPPRPRVGVVGNDALGNFVVLTPLVQALRTELGAEVHGFGGTRVQDLAAASDLFASWTPLLGLPPREAAALALQTPLDLVVNVEASPWPKAFTALLAGPETQVCGPCLSVDGREDLPMADDDRGRLWLDPEWVAEDLTRQYPFLRSGFIGDLFLRLAYLEGPLPPYRLPSAPPPLAVPDVLVATAASLPEKLWPVEAWLSLASTLRADGLTVGLLGAAPAAQARFWQGAEDEERLSEGGVLDLRGRLTLPEVVGAIARARLVVSLDNGVLHLAAATPTPTVGLFRHGIHRLWAPPIASLTVLTPGEGRPVASIPVHSVLDSARSWLKS